jgi:hypothetical protein
MDKILKLLKIDETYTKATKLPKKFNKVKDNIPLIEDYNFMADLLLLPETEEGFKYLLVVVDLATNDFDIEPMKNKEPSTTLKSMKAMFKRKYIKEPYASISTDGGTEFKGIFHKYLYDKSIIHKIAEPGRHKQMSNVENLNRQLGRLFNGYMNSKEEESGEVYREWTDVIETVRKFLNEFKRKDGKDAFTHEYAIPNYTKSKYKIGDIVNHMSEFPLSALGNKQPTDKFREGDYRWSLVPRKIVKILHYPGKVAIRYMLDHKSNVSYADYELQKAKEKEEEFTIKKIIGKKSENSKTYYKIWWKGYPRAEATWERRSKLKKDVPKMLKDYDSLE